MRVRLIRNATVIVELGGRRVLVDPMLDPPGARPPVENTLPARRNPLVPLPASAERVVASADTVLVTHLHQDHFDATAAALIADRLPVFCQPGDRATLAARGVSRVTEVEDVERVGPLRVHRTPGRHGVGVLADELGPVSGFVLGDGTRSVYIAGDTIWCEEVRETIERHRPDAVVVNAAGARFVGSERLVMDVDDVLALCEAFPALLVIAVHLEAINHCFVTRAELRARTRRERVAVPGDGDVVEVAPAGGSSVR